MTGVSVTHLYPINGKQTPDNEWIHGRNVYLKVVHKSMSHKHTWLTNFDPTNKDISITDPRIFKSGNSFVVVYSVYQNNKSYTEFVTVDETGKILARNKVENTGFYTNTYPLLYNNKIIWISPYFAGMEYSYSAYNTRLDKYKFEDTGRVYLFEVDISSPASPKWIEGVRPQSIAIDKKNFVLEWGDAVKIPATVLPANCPFDEIILTTGSSFDFNVTSDGYVLAVNAAGRTGTITAKSYYESKISASVTVKSNRRANNDDIYSMRPASNLKMVVNAAGEKNTNGTWIILWTHEDLDAPNHAEFRFIPVK